VGFHADAPVREEEVETAMIISASRRTDLPALYGEWFMHRIRAGYCLVLNPFNARQVSRVSLEPRDVDVIVFWTRNPRPMFRHLSELDQRGYRYVFHYTLLGYPRFIERGTPALESSMATFRELSERIGPHRITWRYDPIFLTSLTDDSFHRETFQKIAETLRGYTGRTVTSIMERYRKLTRRLKELHSQGVHELEWPEQNWGPLLRDLSGIARHNGMSLSACAQERDLSPFGIEPGRCIDGLELSRIFGLPLDSRRDPSQRPSCGCTVSRDIGAYDTCVFGCVYCYATASFDKARAFLARHDPWSEHLQARQDSLPLERPCS
jgi:DNA repair photolyase